jgi:hypothetical protein
MIFYTLRLRLGGSLFVMRNNVVLLWSLIFAVMISSVLRFASPQRFIAILLLGVSLAAFHIAVPSLLSPTTLIRLWKNKRGDVRYGTRPYSRDER